MDLLKGSTKRPPTSNRPPQMGAWQCVNNLGKALITSGYGLALILVSGFVATFWAVFGGMESADKKAALLAVLGWPALSLTGWMVAAITIVASKRLIEFQAKAYERQIESIRRAKDEALTIQEKLNLNPPNPKKDA